MKRLPIGRQVFTSLINDRCLYVDKTADIHRHTEKFLLGAEIGRPVPPFSVFITGVGKFSQVSVYTDMAKYRGVGGGGGKLARGS